MSYEEQRQITFWRRRSEKAESLFEQAREEIERLKTEIERLKRGGMHADRQ